MRVDITNALNIIREGKNWHFFTHLWEIEFKPDPVPEEFRRICLEINPIAEYDKRADVENLVGEAKREGLDMILSAKFQNNYVFFQIVMLAYNIWRYPKILAHDGRPEAAGQEGRTLKGIVNNMVRIARLKPLFIAVKVVKDGNRDKVKYSIHDARRPELLSFLDRLDKQRGQAMPWLESSSCSQRFAQPA